MSGPSSEREAAQHQHDHPDLYCPACVNWGEARMWQRLSTLADEWSLAAGKPGQNPAHNARRAVYLRCRDALRAALTPTDGGSDE